MSKLFKYDFDASMFDELDLTEFNLDLLRKGFQNASPKSKYREINGIEKIDESISELIKNLNEREYFTLASCSGVQSEHALENLNSGYISFDIEKIGDKINDLKSLILKAGFIDFEEGECYFKKALTIRTSSNNEDDIKKQWGLFLSVCDYKYL